MRLCCKFQLPWIYLSVWCILVLRVYGYLNILSNEEVQSVFKTTAELPCTIETDKVLKEVIWYRLFGSNQPKRVVYYYEPPKYNATGLLYKNRAQLASDASSLLLNSVTMDDEGVYDCHVAVAANNNSTTNQIPEESVATMLLSVNVPPNDVKLTTFSSGTNLTLTCHALGAKPAADISWTITDKNGNSRDTKPAKVVIQYKGKLADSVAYLYWNVKPSDKDSNFACTVFHPDTGTYIENSKNLTAPSLLHPITKYFDWLGADVPYATYESMVYYEENPSLAPPAGAVKVGVFPSPNVLLNTSVTVSISVPGAFPEPSYTWWSEDSETKTGRVYPVKHLTRNQILFCLVENPLGSVVISVKLAVTTESDEGSNDSSRTGGNSDEEEMVSGGIVAAIAFAVIGVLFLLAILIYCCLFKRNSEKPSSAEGLEGGDFDSFVVKQKPLYSANSAGQTEYRQHDYNEGVVIATESDALLKSGQDDTPRKDKAIFSLTDQDGTSTSTSGYGDENGGRNAVENGSDDELSPDEKERAINKHLHDFDENASFVDEYGSTFGLDGADPPVLVESEARQSPFDNTTSEDNESDNTSIGSGASGVEGHYSLTHSWDEIDPNQPVQIPI
ncbi:uncharacterized protein LOC143452060 isoform X1 [Clavelina lepadiformis]|uniref:uncharacterized protein LOC143452060 isoform X1 n=1 Tax=Clavelina lepadiformis TaxID=159417 RepID=UPI0040412F45